MNKVKNTVTVKQLREWLITPPSGMTITYISGKGDGYSWGSVNDNYLLEELAKMTDRQHVNVSLENTLELHAYEDKIKNEAIQASREQKELASLFHATKKHTDICEDSFVRNTYITYTDEVHGITMTDFNGITKYSKI